MVPYIYLMTYWASPLAQTVKASACNAGDPVQSLGQGPQPPRTRYNCGSPAPRKLPLPGGHGGQQDGVCQQVRLGSQATDSVNKVPWQKRHPKPNVSEVLRWAGLPSHTSSISQHSAAAAKSLQSCPTLCDPIDGSPPGSPVPGILQARTLEWLAISFSLTAF